MDKIPPKRRRGREHTKAQILAIAKEAFSEIGYSQAGIRHIAARAGVTSPMVLHYFGSKVGLFEAALTDTLGKPEPFQTTRENFGKHLISLLSNRELEIQTTALMVLSIGDAEARAVTAKVTEEHGLLHLAEWLGPPHGYARAMEILMLAISYQLFTRHLPLVPQGSDTDDEVIEWAAETIQRIVDRR